MKDNAYVTGDKLFIIGKMIYTLCILFKELHMLREKLYNYFIIPVLVFIEMKACTKQYYETTENN